MIIIVAINVERDILNNHYPVDFQRVKQVTKRVKMASTIKPIIVYLQILSLFLGNVIDIKKLKSTNGIIFRKCRFAIVKVLILFLCSSGTFIMYGAVLVTEGIR